VSDLDAGFACGSIVHDLSIAQKFAHRANLAAVKFPAGSTTAEVVSIAEQFGYIKYSIVCSQACAWTDKPPS
jgi:hypothetical protein